MGNIFLSHSYILVFLPKSLFSITLILICIILSHHIVRKSFLFPLHCIALQEKYHFLHALRFLISVMCEIKKLKICGCLFAPVLSTLDPPTCVFIAFCGTMKGSYSRIESVNCICTKNRL